MKHPKTKIITVVTALLVAEFVVFDFQAQPVAAISQYCKSEKCKAAAAAEEEATKKASAAKEAANTLEDEVERLNDEIAVYEARIATNTAKAEDLEAQIKDTTEQLEAQRTALGVMMSHEWMKRQKDEAYGPLKNMVQSETVGEYFEKSARDEAAQSQVSLSSQKLKDTEEELENEKKEVDRILADQELQRTAISEKREEKNTLIAKYKNNASAFSKEASAARKAQAEEIAKEIAKLNSGGGSGVVTSGVNTYPYKKRCPGINLAFIAYGGYVCQCTSYAGWKVKETWGYDIGAWGNANTWHTSAESLGFKVNHTPKAGTVAVSTAGYWGHVMWVEGVNSDGTINLSEYNNYGSSASGLPGDFGHRSGVSTAGLWFIHFK